MDTRFLYMHSPSWEGQRWKEKLTLFSYRKEPEKSSHYTKIHVAEILHLIEFMNYFWHLVYIPPTCQKIYNAMIEEAVEQCNKVKRLGYHADGIATRVGEIYDRYPCGFLS